jgi:hypothetical protein
MVVPQGLNLTQVAELNNSSKVVIGRGPRDHEHSGILIHEVRHPKKHQTLNLKPQTLTLNTESTQSDPTKVNPKPQRQNSQPSTPGLVLRV